MDRTSRFQNPMSLSSGGFNKPPSIQNEGVGMKPLPPMILDRFRAMVKEREDELKVFGGGALLPLSTDEIVRIYEIVLSELTMNSKPIITDLTIIAGEQRAHVEGIADAICARIIEVPADQKLPSLYLLDSIVKNIGKEYIKHFAARLPVVFCEAYAQVHPSMHPAMRHLFGTWATVFPLIVLQTIEAQLQFSPSMNRQPTGSSSTRASESPRPTRGIHINPKYLEVQPHFGHSTIDPIGTEELNTIGRSELGTSGLEAVKKSLPSTSRIMRPSSPYKIGHVGSFSPLIDEFGKDGSPNRIAFRTSPSRPGINPGLSRVMGKDEDTHEWRNRNWQGISSQYPKTSASHKYGNGADLSGPRALISAYGMDEREKNLKRKHPVDSNGADQKAAIKTWQNTEEEEFDWEDMNPTHPPPSKLMSKHGLTTNHAGPPLPDYRGNLSKSGRESINNSGGVLPNAAGSSDVPSQIPPNMAREPLSFPHHQPQRNVNVEAGSPYDLPAPDIRSADDASAPMAWGPTKLESSHALPSLSSLPQQIHTRGQFGMNSAGNMGVDQSLNKTVHNEHHFSITGSMSQLNLPQIHGQRPPINLQNASLPNSFMVQGSRQNFPLPSSVPPPSNPMIRPLNYGYMGPMQGPPICTASSILIPGGQPSMPIHNAPNMPFNVHGGAVPSLPGVPLPGPSQPLPIGQIAPNPPAGSAFTGLISSLMAQGLISATKQDSVGLEFDQDMLKVRHESAITALYADLPRQCKSCGRRFKDQEEHSKHMDWHVSKDRTLKNRKTKPPPKYFVSVSMLLRGTEAVGPEAVPGFLPAESTVEKKDDEELAVPADEDQNTCALCGEPFEDFYSDEMEEWMYKGAVYMYAAAGSTAGMDRSQLGPIVHAKCRSDSHEDFGKDKGEPTEEDRRKRLQS
ncbi:polyadenylation and cleavage factor homolog 4 isoform X2 [Andrographis paniculata]|uniref:polyadenylation and cleavage factor homolog 4 isoform X2 n=1 Tax=Andrographis paniculata TaxID=175694 RepID=UPI0021E8FE88|nr:polyadenylation and cleavage factor homolog 4 isoform X2 [Andrographis paniculata]